MLEWASDIVLFWVVSIYFLIPLAAIIFLIPLLNKLYSDIIELKNEKKVFKSPNKISYKFGDTQYEDYIYLKLGSTLMDSVWKIYAGEHPVRMSISFRKAKKEFDKIIKENKFTLNSTKYFI